MSTCKCVYIQVQGPLRVCPQTASGLPYYGIIPVCVPAVLGSLDVWRHDNKTKHCEVWIFGLYNNEQSNKQVTV